MADLIDLTDRLLDRALTGPEPEADRGGTDTVIRRSTIDEMLLTIISKKQGLNLNLISLIMRDYNQDSISSRLSKLSKVGKIKRAKVNGVYHYFLGE